MADDDHKPEDESVNEDQMKELLEQWGGDNPEDDSDEDSVDDEDSIVERAVDIQNHVVDHVVLACGDLDAGIQEFEKITGTSAIITETSPAYVVKGLGIRCARVGFNNAYLEIIAPDGKSAGPIGALIQQKGIANLTLFHYAIRCDLDQIEELAESSYVTDRISLFGGNTKDGEPRKWDVVFLHGHGLAGICPFFIHWRRPEFHPCTYLTLNENSSWGNLTVTAPADDPLHGLMDKVGSIQGMTLQTGEPNLTFSFTCPEGPVSFSASSAVGFKFPGFESEEEDVGEAGEDQDFAAPDAPELMDVPDSLPPTIESST